MALISSKPMRRLVISSLPRTGSKRQPASVLMSGSGSVQPFLPTRRIFVPAGPSSIAVELGRGLVEFREVLCVLLRIARSQQIRALLTEDAVPNPGLLALADSTHDGLYWPPEGQADVSPLEGFVEDANLSERSNEKPEP